MFMPRTTLHLLRQACPPGLAIHGSELAVNVGWFCSMQQEIFLQIKFIIFQGHFSKQVAFLSGHLSPLNQLLIQLLLLV